MLNSNRYGGARASAVNSMTLRNKRAWTIIEMVVVLFWIVCLCLMSVVLGTRVIMAMDAKTSSASTRSLLQYCQNQSWMTHRSYTLCPFNKRLMSCQSGCQGALAAMRQAPNHRLILDKLVYFGHGCISTSASLGLPWLTFSRHQGVSNGTVAYFSNRAHQRLWRLLVNRAGRARIMDELARN